MVTKHEILRKQRSRTMQLSPKHILESVHPECAILYPEAQSDIDLKVMHENRNDADLIKVGLELKLIESGNDAKFSTGNHKNMFVYKK